MKNKILMMLFVFLLASAISVSAQSLDFGVKIVDFDIASDDSMLYFVAEQYAGSDIYLGAVEINLDGSLGEFNTRVIGSIVDGNVLSMDYQNGYIWVGYFDKVQVWYSVGNNRYGINNALNKTYNSPENSSASFRDIKARPFYDGVAYACETDAPTGMYGFYGVVAFKINVGSGNLEPLHYIDSYQQSSGVCRGIEITDSAELFVDNGIYGIGFYDVEGDHNLTQMSYASNRAYFWTGSTFGVGRSDLITWYGDYMFVTDGGTTSTSESIQRIDYSNMSSPVYLGTQCKLSQSTTNSKVMSIQAYNESVVFFVDKYDGSIHACQFVDLNTTYSVRVWENPEYDPDFNIAPVGKDLEYWTDGGVNYFYTDSYYDIISMYELKTSYDEGGNSLPYFTTQPDTQFIDNLNPVAVGVEVFGLDSAEVNTYPLNCRFIQQDCTRDPEGDDILFAVDKDISVFDNPAPAWWSYEGYSTTYSQAGNYTMRIYITDTEHPNFYGVYRDFDIVVSGNATPLPENYSTLRFKVFDSSSEEEIEGVYVNVEGVGSSYTDVEGETDEVVPEGVYLASFSKNGYVSTTHSYSTSSVQHFVYLDSVSDGSKRTLTITIKTQNGSYIADAYVQTQTKIYNTYDYKFTDETGKATFFLTEDNIVVTIDVDGYDVAQFEVFVPLGSSVSRVVTLSPEGAVVEGIDDAFVVTGCQDYVNGVLLCDYDKTECDQDSDCLTDYCVYNALTMKGSCANFNYNLCDEQEMERGNRCIAKNLFAGAMRGVGNWITDNFFYVLIIVFLLVGGLVLALRHNK